MECYCMEVLLYLGSQSYFIGLKSVLYSKYWEFSGCEMIYDFMRGQIMYNPCEVRVRRW